MSTSHRRSLVVAGLGLNANADSHPVHLFETILSEQFSKLNQAGFDAEHISLDPKDVTGSIAKLQSLVKSKDWDGFEVGFAVRGAAEHTNLFEKAVNVFAKGHPGKALIFPKLPTEIAEAAIDFFEDKDQTEQHGCMP